MGRSCNGSHFKEQESTGSGLKLSAAKSEKQPWTGVRQPQVTFRSCLSVDRVGLGFLVGHQGGGDSKESPGRKHTVKGQRETGEKPPSLS